MPEPVPQPDTAMMAYLRDRLADAQTPADRAFWRGAIRHTEPIEAVFARITAEIVALIPPPPTRTHVETAAIRDGIGRLNSVVMAAVEEAELRESPDGNR